MQKKKELKEKHVIILYASINIVFFSRHCKLSVKKRSNHNKEFDKLAGQKVTLWRYNVYIVSRSHSLLKQLAVSTSAPGTGPVCVTYDPLQETKSNIHV